MNHSKRNRNEVENGCAGSGSSLHCFVFLEMWSRFGLGTPLRSLPRCPAPLIPLYRTYVTPDISYKREILKYPLRAKVQALPSGFVPPHPDGPVPGLPFLIRRTKGMNLPVYSGHPMLFFYPIFLSSRHQEWKNSCHDHHSRLLWRQQCTQILQIYRFLISRNWPKRYLLFLEEWKYMSDPVLLR